MKKTRTHFRNLLISIKYIQAAYVPKENDIIELSNQAEYDRTIKHYDDLITVLTKEIQTLPIGYRYTGTFYLKKPYTMPPEFEEHSGSIYMRENLVSWQIEKEPGRYENAYYRAAFKQPNGSPITREEAEPVYQKEK